MLHYKIYSFQAALLERQGDKTSMDKLDLNNDWELTYESLSWGIAELQAILSKQEGWLPCNIPCDVHVPLIAQGIIKEPLEALNCYDSEWIEDKSWWFRKIFSADNDLLDCDAVELTLESLDAEADIFINGFHLAHHKSAFYPYTADIKKMLKQGDNTLIVRVTSGLENVSDQDIAAIGHTVSTESDGVRGIRGDKRRAFVRKPQYVYGWDWGPRIASCGIMKNVYIKAYKKIAVRGVHVITRLVSSQSARLDLQIEVENLHPFKSFEGSVDVKLLFDGKSVCVIRKEEHLRSGINYINLTAEIENPQLWWPNGMGCQNLYTVRTSICADEIKVCFPEFKYGVRTLRLSMEKLNDRERIFAFEVNGVKVYCKGGNWIPADSIYGRITDEKYENLIREARDANFTMLRVWGGGIYEKDIFYEKCDENGILLWHDFMFACAMYPDNEEWFRTEVTREMEYQTRRLRNHSCMALWCGNNENSWGFNAWWVGEKHSKFYGGATCYNIIAPEVVQKNCPEIPYWNSSPYGGDDPNSSEIGDRHHWGDCTMNPEMDKRITPEEYDKITSRFISEYGYIGPCAKSTIARYHAGNPVDREGAIWKLHNNTFEKETVIAGIVKHYADIEKLDMDGYLLYAGLCQGLMYQYSLEAIRFKKDCWGSLFWMYDDCWGEVGWTIIDYYLRRKPSYYYVKRAFAPVKLILREENGRVSVMGVNETGKSVRFGMEYGYASFDGILRDTKRANTELPSFSREIVYVFDRGAHDFTQGVCFVKPDDPTIAPATLRTNDFRNLHIEKADITVDEVENRDGSISFTVSSHTFAHAVHFGLEDEIHLSDEYFDLLPNERRRIEIQNAPKDLRIKPMHLHT
jgi:beta-mannosidase